MRDMFDVYAFERRTEDERAAICVDCCHWQPTTPMVRLWVRSADRSACRYDLLSQAHHDRRVIFGDLHNGQDVGSRANRGDCICGVWHNALACDEAAAFN